MIHMLSNAMLVALSLDFFQLTVENESAAMETPPAPDGVTEGCATTEDGGQIRDALIGSPDAPRGMGWLPPDGRQSAYY